MKLCMELFNIIFIMILITIQVTASSDNQTLNDFHGKYQLSKKGDIVNTYQPRLITAEHITSTKKALYPTWDNLQYTCLNKDLDLILAEQIKLAQKANTHFSYFNVLLQYGYFHRVVHNNPTTHTNTQLKHQTQEQIDADKITAQKFQPKLEDIDVLQN